MTYELNIIAAEDDLVSANSMKRILEEKKCKIEVVSTGEELLQKLTSEHDLVLLDLELPGMDGLEVAKKIRENNSVPIVALTAHQEKETVQLARQIGINGFLTKPLSPHKCTLLLNDFKSKRK